MACKTMHASKGFREWLLTEELPRGFTECLNDIVLEQEEKKCFIITGGIGVPPSILNRWIAGLGRWNYRLATTVFLL